MKEAARQAAIRMEQYVKHKREFKTLQEKNCRVDVQVGVTQDGKVCILFASPIKDLILTPQEAEILESGVAQAIREARKSPKR